MTGKPYGMLMVTLLNRDDQSEKKVAIYPVTKVEIMDMSRGPAGKPRFTIIPNEDSNWRIDDG